MPRVTSKDNPRLTEAARLVASSRDRRKSGKCVLEGDHLIGVYLARGGRPQTLVVVAERAADPRIAALAAQVPPRDVLSVSAALFAGVSTLPADVGALAIVATPAPALPPPARRHLLLDDVQDPGNVGTLLRTAAAAGVEQVLLSPRCAFAWSPKALRAGQGAHFLTTLIEDVELPGWARAFRGQVIVTAADAANDLYATALREPWAVVIGNEGAGVSPALAAEADVRVAVPMPGGTESLNAAAAAAVVLFELVRRRRAGAAQ
ncbi:MAG: RNA methyltransferase [Burkholderiales bacterium]|nr:RNA methyltransferase [Burkholderiales bacterium]